VCLWLGGSVTTITRNCVPIDPHQTGFVGKGSNHLQLIKFWPSRAAGKGVCGGAKISGSASAQCLRILRALFSFFFYIFLCIFFCWSFNFGCQYSIAIVIVWEEDWPRDHLLISCEHLAAAAAAAAAWLLMWSHVYVKKTTTLHQIASISRLFDCMQTVVV